MRKNIVAGNWKMNTTPSEGEELISSILSEEAPQNVELIICPPFTHLSSAIKMTADSSVKVGAQNCHQEQSGAYTGEVSVSMLKDLNVEYVILGHSERRAYFGEDNQLLSNKVNTCIDRGLNVIYCCGETLDDRVGGNHFDVVWKQISEGLFHLPPNQLSELVVAYEPVWAIGTGKTASAEQAQEMHNHIRKMISDRYTPEIAEKISILYGGSVKPDNAKELFSQPDIDGGLIGGAALKADSFLAIARSF